MRVLSAAASKRNESLLNGAQMKPREGTALRGVYDFFISQKGVPIAWKRKRGDTNIDRLKDIYGLDIRCLRQGLWVLAGEWFGSTYVDYIADRIGKDRS